MNLHHKFSSRRSGSKVAKLALSSVWLILIMLVSGVVLAQTNGYSIKAPADWITVPEAIELGIDASSATTAKRKAKRGVYYQLADRQINVIDSNDQSTYYAWDFRLTNTTGVSNNSTIQITFDPSYESLVLHQVGLMRDGQYIDKLGVTDFELLQTEKELDELIYNGTKTLTGILQDVRVGDAVRYSYTITGRNPVFDDLIEYSHRTQHYVPMASSSFKLLASAYTPIVVRKQDMPSLHEVTHDISDGVRTLAWSAKDLKPKKYVDNVNEWSRYEPSFSVSSVMSWEDIVKWSLPKYTMDSMQSDELITVANNINKNESTKEGKIGAALQWVQNEIRYFGIELGANSHNPSTPDETLDKRYGDCKDKTVLLIALLHELGIESYPALVNTNGSLRNEDNPHRLHAFDHVIVHLELHGKKHWIDPTRTNQLGALNEIFEPNYGYALIVAKGQNKLSTMSDEYSSFDLSIVKQLELDSENDNAGTFSVWSNRKGVSAEYHRGYVNNHGLQSISDDYVSYYRDRYNSIELENDIQSKEAFRNSIYTTEHYRVDDLWSFDIDDQPYFEVEADETARYLHAPKSPRYRKEAYAIQYPVNVDEKFIIKLPNKLVKDRAYEKIENKHFTYTVNVDQNNVTNSVKFTHKYQSHSLEVPVEDLRQYAKDIERARDISSLYIDKNGFEFMDEEETNEADKTPSEEN